MMLNYYINFILFAFVASITPGPTNLICFMLGSNRGANSARSFIIGSSLSAALILGLSGLGLATLMMSFPMLKIMMTAVGLLWISYLSYQLFVDTNQQSLPLEHKIVGFKEGAILQLINPKTWVMALSVNGIFSLPQTDNREQMLYLSVIFFMVAMPCLLSWTWLGQSAALFNKWQRLMNRCLAVLLFLSVWLSVFMISI